MLTTMELMVLAMAMASPMPDMAMEPTPMPTMERGLPMLSLRLMPMLTTMVLVMAMPVLAMLDMAMLLPTPMVDTTMASKKSTTSNQSRPPSTNAEAQKQTKS